MKRKCIKRIMSLLMLCVMTFTLMPLTANAANVCSSVWGTSSHTVTFSVTTGKSWISGQKVNLRQYKGTFRQKKTTLSGGSTWVRKNMYGTYYVTVKNMNTGKIYKYNNKKWNDKNMSLSLAKNTRYKITVKPASVSEYNISWQHNASKGWEDDSSWEVKKTRNITLCR